MITLLIGNDSYEIKREIAQAKAKTDSHWQAFNFHRFNSSSLEEAIATARTFVFGNGNKVIVVENCDFKSFGEEGLDLLQCLPQLPSTTHLILTAASIDKRLKVSKYLLKQATLKELMLIPPWRKDLIANVIKKQAKELQLRLNREIINYLVDAIGNDTARAASELRKLAVYAQGNSLKLSQVKSLIPATTSTNLELAEAVRKENPKRVTILLNELLARGEYPLAIIATLITQFRTWLWVKLALNQGIKKDLEIAQSCQIGNPKRLYYLRNEVKGISEESLSKAVTELLELEVALKSGNSTQIILPSLLKIIQEMKLIHSQSAA